MSADEASGEEEARLRAEFSQCWGVPPESLDAALAEYRSILGRYAEAEGQPQNRIDRMLHYCDLELARRQDQIGADPRHETGVIPIRVVRAILGEPSMPAPPVGGYSGTEHR